MKKNHGFTLAEILIVLTVIGILSVMLLPIAMQALPNDKVIKFKKSNAGLSTVIRMMINENDVLHNKKIPNSTTYFCESFANLISAKNYQCKTSTLGNADAGLALKCLRTNNTETFEEEIDKRCKQAETKKIESFVTDISGTTYYEEKPEIPFSWIPTKVEKGIDCQYKILCLDIDEINNGEDPFGYGIRQDGKIAPGKRAQEWVNKATQNK